MTLGVVISVVALAQDASAEEAPGSAGQSWSVVGPKTVAPNGNVLEGAVGWPGLSVGYLRGIAPKVNLGGRFGFVYGVEGLVRTSVVPGIKLQVLTKFTLLERGKISLGVTFEPGPVFHFYGYTTLAAFTLPVGFRLGIAASSALQLAVLFDLPFWVSFGTGSSFNMPILTGVGVEYFLQSDLALFLRLRMGPTIYFRGYPAEFTLESVVGVGWRFQ
jgi:hypothetical protein